MRKYKVLYKIQSSRVSLRMVFLTIFKHVKLQKKASIEIYKHSLLSYREE